MKNVAAALLSVAILAGCGEQTSYPHHIEAGQRACAQYGGVRCVKYFQSEATAICADYRTVSLLCSDPPIVKNAVCR